MNPRTLAVSYGALELKRSYQHNLLAGVMIAACLHAATLGVALLYTWMSAAEMLPPQPPAHRDVRFVPLPPPTITPRPDIKLHVEATPPAVGIPIPVPDEDVTEVVRFPTRTDLAELRVADFQSMSGMFEGGFDSIVVGSPEDYFPEPGEFVAYQEAPSCVHAEPVVYPEMARLSGREGSVKVLALVRRDGTVERVMVGESSGTNAGFEEAALDAVSKYLYKPAIQNGNPVAVWVSHRIEFRLK